MWIYLYNAYMLISALSQVKSSWTWNKAKNNFENKMLMKAKQLYCVMQGVV